jgi:hypothetical protein
MKRILALLIGLVLIAGCNVQSQPQSYQTYSEATEENGFCVLTSTSEIDGKNRYGEADDEFLMLDEIFSKPVTCSSNAGCYEYLLDHDSYRSMAPEFEPYLNCESKSISEINFKD